MRTLITPGLVAGATLVVVAVTRAIGTPAPVPARESARRTVIAELFTSEGCSSCPPADALLQQISTASPLKDVEVIGLEEHVDYWDNLGWRDPFSSAAFSRRQSAYDARVFRSGQIYTPQLVVDGAFEAVGSDRGRVRAAIASAAARPQALVRLTATDAGDRAHIEVRADRSALPGRAGAAIVVVVAEDGLVSRVVRGENGGRTLPHSAVVRWMNTAGELGADRSDATFAVDAPLDQAWRRPSVRVIAFVQEKDSLRILGAAATALAGSSTR